MYGKEGGSGLALGPSPSAREPHYFGAAYHLNGWWFQFVTSLGTSSSLTLNNKNGCPSPDKRGRESVLQEIHKTLPGSSLSLGSVFESTISLDPHDSR